MQIEKSLTSKDGNNVWKITHENNTYSLIKKIFILLLFLLCFFPAT